MSKIFPLREKVRESTVSKVMFTSSPCSGWGRLDCKIAITCERGNAKSTQADFELPSIPFKWARRLCFSGNHPMSGSRLWLWHYHTLLSFRKGNLTDDCYELKPQPKPDNTPWQYCQAKKGCVPIDFIALETHYPERCVFQGILCTLWEYQKACTLV